MDFFKESSYETDTYKFQLKKVVWIVKKIFVIAIEFLSLYRIQYFKATDHDSLAVEMYIYRCQMYQF